MKTTTKKDFLDRRDFLKLGLLTTTGVLSSSFSNSLKAAEKRTGASEPL